MGRHCVPAPPPHTHKLSKLQWHRKKKKKTDWKPLYTNTTSNQSSDVPRLKLSIKLRNKPSDCRGTGQNVTESHDLQTNPSAIYSRTFAAVLCYLKLIFKCIQWTLKYRKENPEIVRTSFQQWYEGLKSIEQEEEKETNHLHLKS